MKPGEIVGHVILNKWKKFDVYNLNRIKVTAIAKVVKTVHYDIFEIFYLQLYATLMQSKYIFIISTKRCATVNYFRFLPTFIKKL